MYGKQQKWLFKKKKKKEMNIFLFFTHSNIQLYYIRNKKVVFHTKKKKETETGNDTFWNITSKLL